MLANLGFIVTNWLTSELDYFNLRYPVHFPKVASDDHESELATMQFKQKYAKYINMLKKQKAS